MERFRVFFVLIVIFILIIVGINFIKLKSAFDSGDAVFQIDSYDPTCKCYETYYTNKVTHTKDGFLEFKSSMGIQYQINSLNTKITKLK